MGNRLYLIDVSNMFYRAFWGNEALTTSYGMPVQAIHGVTRMINALIRDQKPTHIIAGLEGGNLLRKQISPLYKANRSEKPEELAKQEEMLPELLKAMGIPAVKIEGYEADDVIGAYAKLAESSKTFDEIVIVSADKDFSQLVTQSIKLYDMGKGLYYGPVEVLAKHGVTPEQFVDYLAIVGDASDNVKGVDGIGPKGAAKLLNEFGNVEGIYANMGKVKGAQKDKLQASASDVELALKLVKIQAEEILKTLPLPILTPYTGVVELELRTLFKRLEFKTLEAEMLGNQTQIIEGVEIGVRK